MPLKFRNIRPEDNSTLNAIITSTVLEFGRSDSEYLHGDNSVDDIYGAFDADKSQYWVIEDEETGRVLGGGGYSRLVGTTESEGICELQKMYFSPEARGKGVGRAMMEKILSSVREDGYKTIYLETVPEMGQAIGLYKRFGFDEIEHRMGATGHDCCSIFMSRSVN